MYIDAQKFDYSQFNYPDADRLVERDKEAARNTYRKWMDENVHAVVDRQWEIDDIGAVERVGDFIRLLKEAEFTYALGAYTSTIALIGVCAEDLCRFFASSAGHNTERKTQAQRVEMLNDVGAISSSVVEKFHSIRNLRNDCLHFNSGFKQKDEAALKADALSALNTIKSVYADIIGVVDYKNVDVAKFSEMVGVIANETVGSDPAKLGVESSLARTRNLFADVFGIDISMNSGEPVYSMSIFRVLEIDKDINAPEITLDDMSSGLPVIIDLTSEELEAIMAEGISEGSVVATTIMSAPNNLETTGLWRLWTPLRKLA